MYSYTKYYIKVETENKEIVSDLVGGEFSVIEAINKFMQLHFPENRAYLPLQEEVPRTIDGKIYKMMSIRTDISGVSKLWVMYKT